jgi:hypothetical protein
MTKQEITLEQAADALRRHYGGKGFEASHEDGPNLMSDAMRQELGIEKEQADDLVHKLMDNQTVRWIARGMNVIPPDTVEDIVPGTREIDHGRVVPETGAHGYWQV